MDFHQRSTDRLTGLVRLAWSAREVRPLPWFTYSPPLLASRNS